MKWPMWFAKRAVLVEKAELTDLELYRGMAVQPGHPVLRSVCAIVDRLMAEQVEQFSAPDVPREVKADAMVAIGTLREVRLQIEAARADAQKVLEQIAAKSAGA